MLIFHHSFYHNLCVSHEDETIEMFSAWRMARVCIYHMYDVCYQCKSERKPNQLATLSAIRMIYQFDFDYICHFPISLRIP